MRRLSRKSGKNYRSFFLFLTLLYVFKYLLYLFVALAFTRVVRVVRWEDDLLFAGIKAEDCGSVSPLAVGQIGCGIACLHCGIMVRGFVAFGAYLHDVAAAIPTVWSEIFIPKSV